MIQSANPNEKKTAGIFLRNIDEKYHRQFKSLCASEGVNMSEALIKYIKECVDENSLNVAVPR